MVKKAKAIILAVVAVVAICLLLFFASPVPEVERGVELIGPIAIALSVLAGIILLGIFIRHIKAIMRSVVANLPSIVTVVAAGELVFMLVYVTWPIEMELKVELLRSVLIASLALVGFASVILVELIRGSVGFVVKPGVSDTGVRKLRALLSRSVVLGCLTILAIMVYFVVFEINIFFVAWIFFILQLALLIFPLALTRIMALR
jgi:hypothetical protein